MFPGLRAVGGVLAAKNKDTLKDKIKGAFDPGVSFGDVKDAFSAQYDQLEELQQQDPEGLTESQKDAAMTRSAEAATKTIAAQQKALADPTAVGTPDARSISRAQAITGEGAKQIASGAAQTAAEIERLSEELELSERDRKSAEIQQLLSNIAAYREMRSQRLNKIFGGVGAAAGSVLGEVAEMV